MITLIKTTLCAAALTLISCASASAQTYNPQARYHLDRAKSYQDAGKILSEGFEKAGKQINDYYQRKADDERQRRLERLRERELELEERRIELLERRAERNSR
jgi:hypothetical protein